MQIDASIVLQVEKLFAKWVWRLRLMDWEVHWKVVSQDDLPAGRSGVCDVSATKKLARIKILHPEDAGLQWLVPYDLELTVVHELIHLHVAPWALLFDEGDQELLLEQTVHALSLALVEADRGDRRWSNFPEFCGVQDLGSMLR